MVGVEWLSESEDDAHSEGEHLAIVYYRAMTGS
jgi:hypothetical protein